MTRLYTIAQVSEITGIGKSTLYHWVEIGRLNVTGYKGGRTRLVTEADVDAALADSKRVNEGLKIVELPRKKEVTMKQVFEKIYKENPSLNPYRKQRAHS